MDLEHLEVNEQLDRRKLETLANLNPCLSEEENLLLSYYKRVRATWSNSAIKNLQRATGLKLRNKLNRCQFAIEAAKQELHFVAPEVARSVRELETDQLLVTSYQIESEPNPTHSSLISLLPTEKNNSLLNLGSEFNQDSLLLSTTNISEKQQQVIESQESYQHQLEIAQNRIKELESALVDQEEELERQLERLERAENFSVLLLTNRLLPPGPPLNGTEASPAMRVLGSPKTLTELEANYRELIKREHPDVSLFSNAVERFAYVRSLYKLTRNYWDILKPTATITPAELEKRMNAPVPFEPQSFWAA